MGDKFLSVSTRIEWEKPKICIEGYFVYTDILRVYDKDRHWPVDFAWEFLSVSTQMNQVEEWKIQNTRDNIYALNDNKQCTICSIYTIYVRGGPRMKIG